MTPAPAPTPVPQTGESRTYVVVAGDNLWKIAVRHYGKGLLWNEIYTANKDTVKNADTIYVGQTLILPALDLYPFR